MPVAFIGRLSAWLSGIGSQRSFIRAVGAVSVIRLTGGVLLFLSQMLLARWMGVDAFGVYSYAWAWVAVLGPLAGLGFAGMSVRFLAMYRVHGADDRIRGLLKFGRVLVLTSSAIVAVCGLLVVTAAARNSPYVSALQAAFLAIPLLAFLGLDAAYARGFNWMALSATAEQIGRPAVLIVFGWLLMQLNAGAPARSYVMICVLAYLIAALAQHMVVRRRIRATIGPGPAELDARVWLRVSAAMLLLTGAEMVRMNTDLVLVGFLLGPADVGVYTAAVRTATLVSFVLNVTSVVAQPSLASLHAENRRADLARFVATTTRSIFVISLLIGAALGLCGQLVLGRFGPGFTASYPALLILIAGHVLVAAFGPLTSLLLMTGHQGAAAAIYGVSAISGAALNIVLIPRFGIAGAAVASGLNLLLMQIALALIVRLRLGLSFTPFGFRAHSSR
jgi:O-antigen/teichoic acid export membrane protein